MYGSCQLLARLDSTDRRISCLRRCRVLTRSLAESLRGLRHIEDIVSYLEEKPEPFTYVRDGSGGFDVRASDGCTCFGGKTYQSTRFISMDILDLFDRDPLPLCLEIELLPNDHSSCGTSEAGDQIEAGFRREAVVVCYGPERKYLQSVAGEDRRRLAEFLVTRLTPSSEIVVVHRRQVVMDQRVSMDHLDRGRGPYKL